MSDISVTYLACSNHGCILSQHSLTPRNRRPLVECCYQDHHNLGNNDRDATKDKVYHNGVTRERVYHNDVTTEKSYDTAYTKQRFAEIVRKNMTIPANYYITTNPRDLPPIMVTKRRLIYKEKRRQFFQELHSSCPQEKNIKHNLQASMRPSRPASISCKKLPMFDSNSKMMPKEPRSRSATPSKNGSNPVERRAHSVDLGVKERYPWVYAVPSEKLVPKNCDEVPEEFRRAGIGACLQGK